jgi:hypothetical protein
MPFQDEAEALDAEVLERHVEVGLQVPNRSPLSGGESHRPPDPSIHLGSCRGRQGIFDGCFFLGLGVAKSAQVRALG